MTRDITEAAIKKHGGLDNIEPERERRHEESLRRKEVRITKKLKRSEAESRPLPLSFSRMGTYHDHYFPAEMEAYDEDAGVWLQSCECGFTIAFEKF